MGPERRSRTVHGRVEVNPSGEEPTDRPRQKNAGLWEPYDGRLSRTVLREREGEVPSRHSPGSNAGPTKFARGRSTTERRLDWSAHLAECHRPRPGQTRA